MKKFNFLAILFLLFLSFVPARSQLTRQPVPFAGFRTSAQIAALGCAARGTLVWNSDTLTYNACTATGAPGTWTAIGGGITIGTTNSNGTAHVLLKTDGAGKVGNSTVTDNGTNVTFANQAVFADGSSGTLGWRFSGGGGAYQFTGGGIVFRGTGAALDAMIVNGGTLRVPQAGKFAFSSGAGDPTTAEDVAIARGAANVLRVTNGSTGLGSIWAANYFGAAVASAATITPSGNVFHVTGTTSITNVSGTGLPSGFTIQIIFDAALTVNDGTGNLRLASNYVTTADDTLTLVWDAGTAVWYELARSVN